MTMLGLSRGLCACPCLQGCPVCLRMCLLTCVAPKMLRHASDCVQAELPCNWKLGDLTSEQMATLDDEAIARIKAREAYERQFAAECRAAPGADDAALDAAFVSQPREQWDCESVLSGRSSVAYQPARIGEEAASARPRRARACADAASSRVQLSAKSGLPLGVPGITLASVREGSDCDGSESGSAKGTDVGRLNLGVARGREESAEDKKARKAAVKAGRRAARATKKDLKSVYAKESSRAQHHAATNTGTRATVVPIA